MFHFCSLNQKEKQRTSKWHNKAKNYIHIIHLFDLCLNLIKNLKTKNSGLLERNKQISKLVHQNEKEKSKWNDRNYQKHTKANIKVD